MSPKEKRMMEAARLRYMEDCSNQEIADRIGIAEKTVRNYFSQEDMTQFKRFYSDKELWEFEQAMEQDVRDGVQLSNNLLGKAVQGARSEGDYKTMLRASDQALKIRERKIKLLQELGVLDKPKERKEITEKGSSNVGDKLAEYYREKMQEQDKESDKELTAE